MYLFVVCVLILYLIAFFSPYSINISKDKTAVLKSLMAIFIVLHHLSLQGIFFLRMFHSWGAPIVSIFLFLSGYGLMKSLYKNGDNYFSDFLKHRIGNGILFSFFIAWGIYRILNIKTLPNMLEEIKELVYNGITVLPHSWFVFAILLFYLFFYFSYKFFRERSSFTVLMLFFILYEFVCQYLNYERCWYISAFSFPVGILFGKYESNVVEYIKYYNCYYLITPVSLIIIAICVYLKIEILYLLVYVLIPFIFAILLLKLKIEKLMKFKLIRYLSNVSFEIYLSQGISMCILRGDFFYINSDYIYVIFTLVFTIIIAIFIRWLKKNLLFYCTKLYI